MNRQYLKAYGIALATLIVIDGLWITFVAGPLFQRELAVIWAPELRIVPALLFYLGYPAGLVALALQPRPASRARAAGRGGIMGLVAYGVYDLTNLATLAAWQTHLAALDMAFGMSVSAAMGALAWGALAAPATPASAVVATQR